VNTTCTPVAVTVSSVDVSPVVSVPAVLVSVPVPPPEPDPIGMTGPVVAVVPPVVVVPVVPVVVVPVPPVEVVEVGEQLPVVEDVVVDSSVLVVSVDVVSVVVVSVDVVSVVVVSLGVVEDPIGRLGPVPPWPLEPPCVISGATRNTWIPACFSAPFSASLACW
jgi:hypothetical protein